MQQNRRRLLIIPAIAAGIAIFMLMNSGKQPTPRVETGEHATAVRFISAQPYEISPIAIGNGSVRPARVWSAISQVQGRVVELPPRFKAGMVIQQGQLLLGIDKTDYELSLAQAEASLRATEAQLKQLQLQESNLGDTLVIEQQLFDSAEKEWVRLTTLEQMGTVSTSAKESQLRAYLSQKQKLQNAQNSLEQLPADRQVLKAQLAQQQAQLDQAKLNLQRTQIYAPFNGRLAEVKVERDQYIRVGELLAVVDDIEQAEIKAQFPLEQFSQLIAPLDIKQMLQHGELPGPKMLNFKARVELMNGGSTITWDAEFSRTDSAIDPQTRTVGAVVSVMHPYRDAMPPLRPPLVKGMYVSVLLEGAKKQQQIAVPRYAIHSDVVYLIDSDERLKRVKVTLSMRQPGYVTIAAGVQAGDRVVVSDLIPAVDGMLLKPIEDQEAHQALLEQLNSRFDLGV